MLDLKKVQQDAETFIVGRVDQHWKTTGTALLLSQIGVPLKAAVSGSEYLLKNGLKQLLIEWPIVQLIQFPGIAEKIGLVPLGTPIPDDVTEIFMKLPKRNEANDGFRYNQRFWKSFISPIDENRFIFIDHGSFEVLDNYLGPLTASHFEIRKDDLVDSNGQHPFDERIRVTYAKIEAWLGRNRLQKDDFSGETIERKSQHKTDLFEDMNRLFGSLSEEDKSRISLPLDILMKLFARR